MVTYPGIWDVAGKLKLTRRSYLSSGPEVLDRGVNFFVLALEELGATTRFSCDGHGSHNRFYVLFEAPYTLALSIRSAGYFDVLVEGPHLWSIRFSSRIDGPWKLSKTLRYAADAWVHTLGLDPVALVANAQS